MLSSHQALTRVAGAALILTLAIVFSQQGATQAGPQAAQPVPQSLLPDNVGLGIVTSDDVHLTFDEPMDPASVEAALQLAPDQDASLSWNDDQTKLSIAPNGLWRTDVAYLITVDESATTASGSALPEPRRFSFSTQTAPTVSDFQVRLAEVDLPQAQAAAAELGALDIDQELTQEMTLGTGETARGVSPSSSIRISFSSPMNRANVEEAFRIAPEVSGDLSWASGGDLVFSPTERLDPGGRYTISLDGARSTSGNELGGKANFSFLVRAGPQLTRTSPALDAQDVEPATVEMWFSQPMDVDATNEAFSLVDASTGRLVAGRLNWNETATQLVYSPDAAFRGERTFVVVLGEGAADANGNAIAAEWSFTTKPGPAVAAAAAPSSRGAAGAAAAPAPVAFVPGPASGLEGYGINQINSARAAYGLGPLALDAGMSAVASAHAWDQLNYGYYSHYSRSGASVQQRLAAGGIGFSAAGENQCHASMGMGAQGTMDWCHGVFMAEPWCTGCWNHIGNILSSRYTRVGIGIADNGSRVVVTWDFAN